MLALVDYSKAYDKVWREELLGHMLELNVPARVVKWCRGFLRNRQAQVRLNGVNSKYHHLAQGLPQGAVLSPLLFSLYIDRVRTVIPVGLSVSMYADDIALWRTDCNKEQASLVVQCGVEAIQR